MWVAEQHAPDTEVRDSKPTSEVTKPALLALGAVGTQSAQ